jgi:predicted HTH domain antitoxin
MHTFTVAIPDDTAVNEFEVRMIVACRLFEEGRITSGQAAEIAGISKRAFLESAGKFGVSIFGYSMQELEDDLKHA